MPKRPVLLCGAATFSPEIRVFQKDVCPATPLASKFGDNIYAALVHRELVCSVPYSAAHFTRLSSLEQFKLHRKADRRVQVSQSAFPHYQPSTATAPPTPDRGRRICYRRVPTGTRRCPSKSAVYTKLTLGCGMLRGLGLTWGGMYLQLQR